MGANDAAKLRPGLPPIGRGHVGVSFGTSSKAGSARVPEVLISATPGMSASGRSDAFTKPSANDRCCAFLPLHRDYPETSPCRAKALSWQEFNLVYLSHDPVGLSQSDNDSLPMVEVVGAEFAAFAVFQPFLRGLIAADNEIPSD